MSMFSRKPEAFAFIFLYIYFATRVKKCFRTAYCLMRGMFSGLTL